MNITIDGTTHQVFTEADLLELCQQHQPRFEIRSEHGLRRYFVDGVEVREEAYLRAQGELTQRSA